MGNYQCTVSGVDEQSGAAPEVFQKTYDKIEAATLADAEANAREMCERDGWQPNEVECELAHLRAIRVASESDLADPGNRLRLVQAARADGASMEQIEAAQRANPHWPR